MTMFLESLSAISNTIGPRFADHLWQSTLCAAAAGLLTLAFRKNSARIRYSLWLAASLKFLVPFSLLASIGSQFSSRHLPVAPTSGMYIVEVVGQPFTKRLPLSEPTLITGTPAGMLLHSLPWLVFCLWLCGFVTVLYIWAARWRQASTALRESAPLFEGRELQTLRRVEHLAKIPKQMNIRLSRALLEPGVFGIVRPVLLWPRLISEHLDDAQLCAVIAHELCHVRRHDNLAAVLHMLVEAVFWFHPLVWWIGTRLIEERERACDEAVLELGPQRRTYAESILKVCEFCLSSRLTCVAGVTGSDLKKRMAHIMNDHAVHKLNLTRKLLLWTAASLAIALPIAFGLLKATPSRAETQAGTAPKFSSVSIKPHSGESNGFVMTKVMIAGKDAGLVATNISPHMLIRTAYRIQEGQMAGEPEWTKSEKYDINAKVDQSLAEQMNKLGDTQRDLLSQQMLRQFLADYFKLALHQETRDVAAYDLVIAEGGAKLEKSSQIGMTKLGISTMNAQGAPLSIITEELSQRLGRIVVDKTGLEGVYNFTLHWTPDSEEIAHIRSAGFPDFPPKGSGHGQPAPTASGPPLVTAIEQQLGLKVQPQAERVPVLVIDHVEKPQFASP